MNEASLNDILQGIGVAFALVVCVIYVVRKIRRKGGAPTDCAGCPLAEHCAGKKADCTRPPSSGCGCGCH